MMRHHFITHRRRYLEVVTAILILGAAYLIYTSQESRIDTYLAKTFPSSVLSLGQVLSVQPFATSSTNIGGAPGPESYLATVRFLTGANIDTTTTVIDQSLTSSTAENYLPYQPGEDIMLAPSTLEGYAGQQYYITDRFRLPALLFIVAIFAAIVILLGRRRGLTSLIGLAISILILTFYIVPQILQGADPLTVCFIGAGCIAIASLYLAHGFNERTTIAVIGTLVTLTVTAILAVVFIVIARLVGVPTDESFYLQIGEGIALNLRGILLGGIIIGSLGVLDDVTIGQSHTVGELHDANPSLSPAELYRRAMSIGREHIASLVNTLFLAYAGVALPSILYIAAFQNTLPIWLMLNGEPIAEEIVRTMVGSIGIMLAVPITTGIAAWRIGKKNKNGPSSKGQAA